MSVDPVGRHRMRPWQVRDHHNESDQSIMRSATVPAVTDAMIRSAAAKLGRTDLHVTIARPEQYGEVEALSRAANPAELYSPLTAELIAWFVDQNPCGKGFVVLARDAVSRSLCGYFLFYPWLLSRRAGGTPQPLTAFLYVHLYVATHSRRRGVFAAMTAFGLDLVERLGVGLAYTVPNPRSTPGFLKFGMSRAGLLPFWIRPAIPGWGSLAGLGHGTHGLRVERSPGFDPSQVPILERTLPQSATIWSPRTVDGLTWRYVRRPDCQYEIRHVRRGDHRAGTLVTRRMRIKGFRTLVVCDAWTSEFEPAAFRLAIEDALRSGERTHIAIAFGGNASGPYRQALRQAGFLVCPSRLQPQPVAVIGGGVGDPGQRVDLPSLSTWHVTPYDWDVF